MPKIKVEIPSQEDQAQDIIDAGKGIVEVIMLERRIAKEAQEYGLTKNEVAELRDAYTKEELQGPLEGMAEKGIGKIFPNGKTERSSGEILEDARTRGKLKKDTPPSLMDYYDGGEF